MCNCRNPSFGSCNKTEDVYDKGILWFCDDVPEKRAVFSRVIYYDLYRTYVRETVYDRLLLLLLLLFTLIRNTIITMAWGERSVKRANASVTSFFFFFVVNSKTL